MKSEIEQLDHWIAMFESNDCDFRLDITRREEKPCKYCRKPTIGRVGNWAVVCLACYHNCSNGQPCRSGMFCGQSHLLSSMDICRGALLKSYTPKAVAAAMKEITESSVITRDETYDRTPALTEAQPL